MTKYIKRVFRKVLPNVVDAIRLTNEKRNNDEEIHRVLSMDTKEYPQYLKDFFVKKTGHQLNLDEPKRFMEKVQWRKLYDQDPIYTLLSDKYKVRKWIAKKIGEQYLIPLLGHWESFDDIPLELFPDQFVLKTNNGSHTNIIVKNKSEFLKRKNSARKRMEYWLHTPFAYLEGLELQYLNIHPQIIAEMYVQPENGKNELVDFKFHCFNGTPVLCQVIGDRLSAETMDFYDMNWNHIPVKRTPYKNAEEVAQPVNFPHMLHLVEQLCAGFQYVRVDMYNCDGEIYFGEMTFTPSSGIMMFEPDCWDYKLGDLWDITCEQVDHALVNTSLKY